MSAPVHHVTIVLCGSLDHELDRVTVRVADPEHCTSEVVSAIAGQGWVLSVGDTISIEEVRP